MSQSQLTLISHHLCPFVQRVAIVLLEKGIPFERINIDLDNKPDWFLAISPTGKVPLLKVLEQNGEESVLFESIAICEYLEETYRQPTLYPSSALSRAQHRAWIEFASATMFDAWGFLNASDHETILGKSAALRDKLVRFDGVISDGPYFTGKNLTMVDIVMAPVFRYFDILEFASTHNLFDGLNQVTDWRFALASRSSIQTAVSDDYALRFRKHLQDVKSHLATVQPATNSG